MKVFPRRQDIPLVATSRDERRRRSRPEPAPRESFGGSSFPFTSLDWNDEALDRVARLSGYEFFVVDPLAWRRGTFTDRPKPDPVLRRARSVDGVVSKPGFGIVSECLVNRKPLVYAERTGLFSSTDCSRRRSTGTQVDPSELPQRRLRPLAATNTRGALGPLRGVGAPRVDVVRA